MSASIAVGCGSASSLDPVDMAVALADTGLVRYLCFDCLSERTLTLAQMRRLADDREGHDLRTSEIIHSLAAYLRGGGRITGNMGAANPDAAATAIVVALREEGLGGTRVGVIRGDDVREQVSKMDAYLPEWDLHVSDVEPWLVSANAYIGAETVLALLDADTQVVIGGRIADPSLYVAPICHELGWSLDDWDRVAQATLAGHLLETGTYTTGGVYADPPYRVVPRSEALGMPWATVEGDDVVVSKAPDAGGFVSPLTVKAMLGYEIHDPGAYTTPDVTADFLDVTAVQIEPDRVLVRGARGRPAPDRLKVLVGIDHGWKSIGEISFGGPGCLERAELAAEIVRNRIAPVNDRIDTIRFDYVGVSSLLGGQYSAGAPQEVRLRVSARTRDREVAERVAKEVEYLLLVGPAGGGGGTYSVTQAVGVTPAYIDRSAVELTTEVVVA